MPTNIDHHSGVYIRRLIASCEYAAGRREVMHSTRTRIHRWIALDDVIDGSVARSLVPGAPGCCSRILPRNIAFFSAPSLASCRSSGAMVIRDMHLRTGRSLRDRAVRWRPPNGGPRGAFVIVRSPSGPLTEMPSKDYRRAAFPRRASRVTRGLLGSLLGPDFQERSEAALREAGAASPRREGCGHGRY